MTHVFKLIGLFIALMAMGCSASKTRPTVTDSGPMSMGDAGPMADAGPLPDDAGPVPTVDAGTDAGLLVETALRIVFDGPAAHNELRGSQDVPMYRFSLTAYEDVEIRRLRYFLYSLTSDDRVIGSAGTEYFRDHKITDADTGVTLMGPGTSGSPYGLFENSFIVRAGETRHLLFTMDLANTEDAFAEFYGDSNNRYRVTVGPCTPDGCFFFSSDGVRRVADGSFVEPEAIENNVRIDGNEITIVDINLIVDMASTPSATIAVKKQMSIPSVGIVFTATGLSASLIHSVRLTGRGNTTGAYTLTDLNNVVTSCALFNGDVQVGLAQAPDAVTGEMRITSINQHVPVGTSVTLEARCTADSVVAQEAGDHYAIGIASASDVEAERFDGSSSNVLLDPRLVSNTTATPVNNVTVMPRGVVTIEANYFRQSTILVGGIGYWQNFAQYRVTARYEAADISMIRIQSFGDAASFDEIAVAADGVVRGSDILPAGTDRSRDVRLFEPFRVERDSSRIIQLWARVSSIVSGASVGGATVGVARTGNRMRLGIDADVVSGEWDVSYRDALNVRIDGAISGDRLYVAGAEIIGNEFVAHKTKIIVTRESLATTTIANGLDQDMYKLRVSADGAGAAGVMGFRFRMYIAGGSVSSLRIRRNDTGRDFLDAIVNSTGPPSNFVTVSFANEQIIVGSGVGYTLHGVVSGFSFGDWISTSFYRDVTGTSEIGYVVPGLWLGTDAGPLLTGILWSDLSEVPHSSAVSALGGSKDWFNDAFIEDLTQVQTITR